MLKYLVLLLPLTAFAKSRQEDAFQTYLNSQKIPTYLAKQTSSCPSIIHRANILKKLSIDPNFVRFREPALAHKKVVIIGAGPVGLYQALAAFRTGFSVTLLEKRYDNYNRDRISYIHQEVAPLLQTIFQGDDLKKMWPAVNYPFDVFESDSTQTKPCKMFIATVCEIESLLGYAADTIAKAYPESFNILRGHEFSALKNVAGRYEVQAQKNGLNTYTPVHILVDSTGASSKILSRLHIPVYIASQPGFAATAQYTDTAQMASLANVLKNTNARITNITEIVNENMLETVLSNFHPETPKTVLQDFGPGSYHANAFYKADPNWNKPRSYVTRSEISYEITEGMNKAITFKVSKFVVITELSAEQALYFGGHDWELQRYLKKITTSTLGPEYKDGSLNMVSKVGPFSTQLTRSSTELCYRAGTKNSKVYITPVGDSMGSIHFFFGMGITKGIFQAEAWTDLARNIEKTEERQRYHDRVYAILDHGQNISTRGMRLTYKDLFTYPAVLYGPLLAPSTTQKP